MATLGVTSLRSPGGRRAAKRGQADRARRRACYSFRAVAPRKTSAAPRDEASLPGQSCRNPLVDRGPGVDRSQVTQSARSCL
jgi:hypothetical protein